MQGEAVGKGSIPTLTRLNNAKFKQMVRPGDVLDITVSFKEKLANAYFMVGRYEDALGMLDRLSPDNDTLSTRTTRAAALAAVSQNRKLASWSGEP